MIELIDTHCHLYDDFYNSDLSETINRAKSEGISNVILPAIDKASWDAQRRVVEQYPTFAYNTAGLHPTSVKESWREELDFALNIIESESIVAVGEIGIDCYWSKEHIKEQVIVFEEQLKLASSKGLPVIIHSRDSLELILTSLQKLSHLNLKGVFHAFSGSYESYQRIRQAGDFMVGIGGVLTFKNSKLSNTVKKMEIDSILLETDAPWLTPAPFRGSRNEPSYIKIIATKLSESLETTLEEIAKTTTDNARRLFNLL